MNYCILLLIVLASTVAVDFKNWSKKKHAVTARTQSLDFNPPCKINKSEEFQNCFEIYKKSSEFFCSVGSMQDFCKLQTTLLATLLKHVLFFPKTPTNGKITRTNRNKIAAVRIYYVPKLGQIWQCNFNFVRQFISLFSRQCEVNKQF